MRIVIGGRRPTYRNAERRHLPLIDLPLEKYHHPLVRIMVIKFMVKIITIIVTVAMGLGIRVSVWA